jgi:hypothetical protein
MPVLIIRFSWVLWAVLALLWGYLRRYVNDGSKFIAISQGISLGCPLPPLMGALYLKPLDDRLAALGCFYVRFMDDWVVLAPTRWRLRKAIKAVNEMMADLRVEQHPDKTFMGRVARGFDFLGYWFTTEGLGIASKSVESFAERVSQLYEQGAGENRIEKYVRRWVKSGVGLYLGDSSCRWGWGAMLLNMLPTCKDNLMNTLIGRAFT